ncbi:MAG: hypothetical protein ACP5T6_03235 [Candidatus Micrarchaeia archaeon]
MKESFNYNGRRSKEENNNWFNTLDELRIEINNINNTLRVKIPILNSTPNNSISNYTISDSDFSDFSIEIKAHNLEKARYIIESIRKEIKGKENKEMGENAIKQYIKELSSFPTWYIFDKNLKDARKKYDHIITRLYISTNKLYSEGQIDKSEYDEIKTKLDKLYSLTLTEKPNPIHDGPKGPKRKEQIQNIQRL